MTRNEIIAAANAALAKARGPLASWDDVAAVEETLKRIAVETSDEPRCTTCDHVQSAHVLNGRSYCEHGHEANAAYCECEQFTPNTDAG